MRRKRAADPDPTRGSDEPHEEYPGSGYTADEQAFLRRVDVLHRRVRFPAAIDYYRLAREALGLPPVAPSEGYDTTRYRPVGRTPVTPTGPRRTVAG